MEGVLGRQARKFWDWFESDSAVARGIFLVFLALAAIIWLVPRWITPAITHPTTTHEIYLPAKAEIVKDVKNFFVKSVTLGGAGGIAIAQIERDLSSYKAHAKENSLHFVMIARNKDFSKRILIDYYGKSESSTHIVHSFDQIPSPQANRWGLYSPVSYCVQNNKLIVSREFSLNDAALGLIVAICLFGIAIALVLNLVFTNSLKSIWQKRINSNFRS